MWWSMAASSVYPSLARASLRGTLDSRRLFVLRGIGELGLVAAEAAAPFLLAARYGSLAGWTGAQACVLVGLARAGQGLALTFARGVEPTEFSQSLRTGRFDQVLTRPVSPLGWQLTADVQARFLLRSAGGAVLAAAGAAASGISATPGRIGAAALAIMASAVLVLSIFILGGALTFFITEGSEAALLLADGGFGLVSFPLDLYGSVLRFVFTFVVPAGLCVYVPALIIVGKRGVGFIHPSLLWTLPLVVGAFMTASLLCWSAGIRRYRSTGS
jgi:ABC-2 type transport system permease protein